jgi:hypothetical protein
MYKIKYLYQLENLTLLVLMIMLFRKDLSLMVVTLATYLLSVLY